LEYACDNAVDDLEMQQLSLKVQGAM
jgi:hypothetical protein